MHPVFRNNHPGWVRYLQECHARQELVRKDADRFGDSAVIPFGACHWWGEQETRRVQQALARPLPAWTVDVGEDGVSVAVECPYCHRTHEYVLVEWPGQVDALCGQGRYALEMIEA